MVEGVTRNVLTWGELGGVGNLIKCEEIIFITRDSFAGELSNRDSVWIPFFFESGRELALKYIIGGVLVSIMFNG